jgi:Rrf2 family protein
MLSQKAKYALRAVLLLAGSESPVTARDIAAREGLPLKFLETILVVLRDAEIVTSRRGRTGGYRLARSATAISFGEVIRAIDGPLAPIKCASRTQFAPCIDCADVETCSIRWSMTKTRDAIADALDGCSLHDAMRHTASMKSSQQDQAHSRIRQLKRPGPLRRVRPPRHAVPQS